MYGIINGTIMHLHLMRQLRLGKYIEMEWKWHLIFHRRIIYQTTYI